jgi:colanic acid/amylovoran biosynthesis glycosyltransferase
MIRLAQGRRLKIAYLVGAFPSPSETFVVSQIAGVAKRGHTVDIYTTEEAASMQIPVAIIGSGLLQRRHRLVPGAGRVVALLKIAVLLMAYSWRQPAILWRTLRAIEHDGAAGALRLLYAVLTLIRLGMPRYDVIHAQFGPYGVLAMRLVQIGVLAGPIVTSVRGYDAGQDLPARLPLYRELFQAGALFLPVSRALAARLIDAGCDADKVRVHHSGIAYRGWHYREREPKPDEPIRLLTVARLVEKKGVAYALQAVTRVIAAGRKLSYVIVGGGPLYAELRALVRNLNIEAHVRLVGAQPHDEVRRLLDASHVLIAPSITAANGDVEGIPNAVKEAMAAGLPVIGTVHGGIPELIEDGVSGLLVPERDAEALARALLALMDRPERWAAMTRAARRKVDGEFNIDLLTDELVDNYLRLATRPVVPAGTAPLPALGAAGRAGHA